MQYENVYNEEIKVASKMVELLVSSTPGLKNSTFKLLIVLKDFFFQILGFLQTCRFLPD